MPHPILVINKSIHVAQNQNDRFEVVVYINGKRHSSYAPCDQSSAEQLAKGLAENDCSLCNRRESRHPENVATSIALQRCQEEMIGFAEANESIASNRAFRIGTGLRMAEEILRDSAMSIGIELPVPMPRSLPHETARQNRDHPNR